MSKETILTEFGLKNLEDELKFLKITKRKEIAEKIKVALSFGDLSENSEYDEAKNEQAIVEAKIIEIENLLKNVKIIDNKELSTESVRVGLKVKIKDISSEEIFEYTLVGSNESNPFENRISGESLVGSKLLDRKIGDVVKVKTASDVYNYEILDIKK
ncbi:MAG: transcription elongation factor GreA [Candidatus Paraimprobicoccus trichonymphae]|uniref:Transcription elongation factor GreA n=1 Tax=Candidatus Paraimprobicoccus trichonymphae TaxID=3033793 RepID=A0AA48HW78_9FIRM|nr:MAG: transcription elongation factor GreA [Candidatus Paraimprobicoccus trichonymphae]